MTRIGLIYAVDGNADYQTLAMQSAWSARQHARDLTIRICVFGPIQNTLKTFARKQKIELVPMKKAAGSLASGLKWFALSAATDFDRVLVADADTVFYDSPLKIFAANRSKDFYAQIEFGTQSDHWRGQRFVAKRIDDKKMARLRKKLGSHAMPIFNSAAMLFNKKSHHQLVERLPAFIEYFAAFHAKTLDYPCSEPFITEEICGSLIMGLEPHLSWAEIPTSQVTHYQSWRAGHYSKNRYGCLMHIGNSELLNWLRDQPGRDFGLHLSLRFSST